MHSYKLHVYLQYGPVKIHQRSQSTTSPYKIQALPTVYVIHGVKKNT